MLIDSPRLSDADRAEWARLARYDRAIAAAGGTRRRLDRLTAKAREEIERFAAAGECHVGVSWGRDSVTVAHLAHGLGIPLIWVTYAPSRVDRLANPDCPAVRDAYLAAWPAPYEEIPVDDPHPYQWIERNVSARRITGLRADESFARARSRAVHGVATAKSCRPIIDWRSEDIWLYAAAHDLPVHPAYAMSFGGVLGRDRLRVTSLGGDRGADHGRWEWENHYYPEVLEIRGGHGVRQRRRYGS